jgi:hypothetical protein
MMTGRMSTDHVAAVFMNRASAEAAVAELRSLGIADEHLGVAIHEPGQLVYEEDVEHDEAVALEEGVLAGVPLGALAGMGLVALALPGIGAVAVGGLLAAGGAAGMLIGGFVGGIVGLTTADHEVEERRMWEDLPLRPGNILVVARAHQRPARVRKALQDHGGSLVDLRPVAESPPQHDERTV